MTSATDRKFWAQKNPEQEWDLILKASALIGEAQLVEVTQ